MWNNHVIMDNKFLFGITNMPIVGLGPFWGSLGREGVDESILQQDFYGAKILLSAATIRMLDDKELVKALRWFSEHEPEITAIGNGSECKFNEQFCSNEDLKLIINSDLVSPSTLKKAQLELGRRQGTLTTFGGIRPVDPNLIAEIERGAKDWEFPKPDNTKPGYVYLLGHDQLTRYKIGRSKDLAKSRGKALSKETGCPFNLEVLWSVYSDNCVELERQLHAKYVHCRKKGEWFELADEEVAEIVQIRKGEDGQISGL